MALSDDDLDRPGRCVEPMSAAAHALVLVDEPANGYAGTMESLHEAKFRP